MDQRTRALNRHQHEHGSSYHMVDRCSVKLASFWPSWSKESGVLMQGSRALSHTRRGPVVESGSVVAFRRMICSLVQPLQPEPRLFSATSKARSAVNRCARAPKFTRINLLETRCFICFYFSSLFLVTIVCLIAWMSMRFRTGG